MKALGMAFLAALSFAGIAQAEHGLVLNYTKSASSPQPGDNKLRAWLKKQPLIHRKIVSIAQDARAVDSGTNPLGDLRDALSSQGKEKDNSKVFDTCLTLENCPHAPTVLHVDNPGDIDEAIVALIRPWSLLQQAKHKALEFRALSNSTDGILRLTLKDLKEMPLEVAASILPGGGITVMLRSRVDPAALYDRERQILSAPSR